MLWHVKQGMLVPAWAPGNVYGDPQAVSRRSAERLGPSAGHIHLLDGHARNRLFKVAQASLCGLGRFAGRELRHESVVSAWAAASLPGR